MKTYPILWYRGKEHSRFNGATRPARSGLSHGRGRSPQIKHEVSKMRGGIESVVPSQMWGSILKSSHIPFQFQASQSGRLLPRGLNVTIQPEREQATLLRVERSWPTALHFQLAFKDLFKRGLERCDLTRPQKSAIRLPSPSPSPASRARESEGGTVPYISAKPAAAQCTPRRVSRV